MGLTHGNQVVATIKSGSEHHIGLIKSFSCLRYDLPAYLRRVRARDDGTLKPSFVRPFEGVEQAGAKVCSLLWKAAHVRCTCWCEHSDKGMIVHLGRRISPVQVIRLPGKPLSQVGEKSLVEANGLFMADSTG